MESLGGRCRLDHGREQRHREGDSPRAVGVGAEVVLSARRGEQIQALARVISSEGGSAVVKPLDVTDKAASGAMAPAAGAAATATNCGSSTNAA